MTAREARPIAATVYRGDAIENTHAAHVAVVDEEGRLLYQFGDPLRITLARSAAKPRRRLRSWRPARWNASVSMTRISR